MTPVVLTRRQDTWRGAELTPASVRRAATAALPTPQEPELATATNRAMGDFGSGRHARAHVRRRAARAATEPAGAAGGGRRRLRSRRPPHLRRARRPLEPAGQRA